MKLNTIHKNPRWVGKLFCSLQYRKMLLDPSAAVVFLAPLAVACISSVVVMNTINVEPPLSLVDQEDPAAWWETSAQWLGTPEKEIVLNHHPYLSIGIHGPSGGTWRTLRRYGSVQSVTGWDPVLNLPIHKAVGNEYIKVMASAYAAASLVTSTTSNKTNNNDNHAQESHLYLGLGAGTLPMLMNSMHGIAIELDPNVAQAAVEYCGLQTTGIGTEPWPLPFSSSSLQIIVGDALQHSKLVNVGRTININQNDDDDNQQEEQQQQHYYSAIFVDIFDATNNVPLPFCQYDFVSTLHASLQQDGVLIANFHRGSAAENQRLQLGRQAYAEVFGGQSSVLSINCRYQGNVILVAVKDDDNKNNIGHSKPPLLNVGQAQRLGLHRQWLFDPASRLQNKNLG